MVVPFEALNNVYRMIDPPHVLLAGESFGETNEFAFDVRLSVGELFVDRADQLNWDHVELIGEEAELSALRINRFEELRNARDIALQEMTAAAQELGAEAIIGIDIDYETVGGQMLMVTSSGTAVKF